MKYMGSKRFMLNNGLGQIIQDQLPAANRVIDPFCGAGSIIYFVAQNSDKEIIAGDLQKYAVVLAKAVIERDYGLSTEDLLNKWIRVAEQKLSRSKQFNKAKELEERYSHNTRLWVEASRILCESTSRVGPVWNAYGGYYFSPTQAITIDYLIKYLPKESNYRNTCLAALIIAASRTAASPGHTAQPFQPTSRASKFIKIAWKIDLLTSCRKAIREIAPMYANTKGKAYISDAKRLISKVEHGDLVILDPPYSGVHYSRFYHVLETIARGQCGPVYGRGRYPNITERPQSKFSKISESSHALEELISSLAEKRATVIFTFPKGQCSNGLSGDLVMNIVQTWFDINVESRIHEHAIRGTFSTMGGNNRTQKNKRVKKSRVTSEELLLLLTPK